MSIEVQDNTKGKPLKEGESYVYFVSRDAQYFGTGKLHKTPDCPHIVNWQPAGWRRLRESGWKQPKFIHRDSYRVNTEKLGPPNVQNLLEDKMKITRYADEETKPKDILKRPC